MFDLINKSELSQQVFFALKLKGFSAGRHRLGDMSTEIWVDGLWMAQIQPSFHPEAVLTIVHETECIRGALSFYNSQ